MVIDLQTLEALAAIGTALGSAWIFVRKIVKDLHKARQDQADAIIKQAREEDSLLKLKLEAKIDGLKTELKSLEFNINKDLNFVKQSHTSELKNLGEKIESLRTELSAQHGSLLALLTKLVEK